MIQSFGVKNFTCFADWMELDLTLNEQVPEKFHDGSGVASLLCLKGSNASGKTNALKAIAFLKDFVTQSFLSSPEHPFELDTFFQNKEPTEFYLQFTLEEEVVFLYEVKLDQHKVYYERLKKDNKIVLYREEDQFKEVSFFNGSTIPISRYASMISSAFYYPETKQAIEPIYDFFQKIFTNVTRFGFTVYPDTILDTKQTSEFAKYYKDNSEAFSFMQEFLQKFDTGIGKVEIRTQSTPDEKQFYYPVFTHFCGNNPHTLLETAESSGTRALFRNLLYYFVALNYSGVLLFDEFDVNLHPDILPYLLEFFTDPQRNPHRAQLIFTTHNNDIMELAGKYRTYLFEKEDNKSICYRLDEINNRLIRNDRSLVRLYEKGLLGGVPMVNAHGCEV